MFVESAHWTVGELTGQYYTKPKDVCQYSLKEDQFSYANCSWNVNAQHKPTTIIKEMTEETGTKSSNAITTTDT